MHNCTQMEFYGITFYVMCFLPRLKLWFLLLFCITVLSSHSACQHPPHTWGTSGNSLAFVLRRFPSCSSTNTNTFLGCVLVLLLHFSAVCFSHQVAARKPLQVRLSGDSDPGLHAHHGPFRPPPTDGHLLYFQCLARVSLGHLLLRGGAFISMSRIPGRRVAGCRLCRFASAIRFMGLLSKGCMHSRSQQQWVAFHSSSLTAVYSAQLNFSFSLIGIE